MEPSGLVRTNYAVRTTAFLYCFIAIGLHLGLQLDTSPTLWLALVLQFLAYPHALYWRASRSENPHRAELHNLYLDSTLFGVWSAGLGFPTWITYGLLSSTMLNVAVTRGAQGVPAALGCSALGAAFCLAVVGLRYWPATSDLVSALCFFGALAYGCAVGLLAYRQKRRLAAARDALSREEERHRLIAENAAELIGMVDRDARWIYASPSYERVLEAPHLEPGADAFRRVHPDDADAARAAVVRVLASGQARVLAMRLVDRDGRFRHYRTRVRALDAQRALLISQEVTDISENEERLLVSARALEGMAEAILITSADGTIVTVNRAFTELTGYSRDEVLGRRERDIRNGLQPPEFYDEVFLTVQRKGYWSGTAWSRRKNGAVYREWRSVRAVREEGGAVTHYVMVCHEVQSRAEGESAARPPLAG
ncbi:MAG TPA: PAS domain S-box protein [Burkholderiales bacterium]|nr:PAS domain S-box protein [Burkholderiales bacterium]